MARIIVVDDEELSRFTVRAILESVGHEVDEAKDGSEGLTLIKKHEYELVILDLVMPRKEGVETIIELKKDRPDQKIVAISGGGRIKNLDYLKIAGSLGVDACIAKPFTEIELLATVDRCLS